MSVCTVIVTFNGSKWIERALDSLYRSTRRSHIIVVDNASSDGTPELLESRWPACELIRSKTNLGFGRANNIGIKRALDLGALKVFLLNQDAYVAPDAIEILESFLTRYPAFGLASPIHCGPDVSSVDRRTLAFYLTRHAQRYISDACLGEVKDHYPIFGINAAAWMLPRETILSVGGFDPLFFMYGEDDDYLDRMAHHGIHCALVPTAKIVHLREKSHESPKTFREQVRVEAEAARSRLIRAIKFPYKRFVGRLLALSVKGVMEPVCDFAITRDVKALLGSWLATVKLLRQLRTVGRHHEQSGAPGPLHLFNE